MSLRVLHINYSDVPGGGAAVAAFRLHENLRAHGVDSRLGVGRKQVQRDDVVAIPRRAALETRADRLLSRAGLNHVSAVSSFRLDRWPEFEAADVVNYHIVYTPYFSYLALPRLTRRKPSVLTLHDMWNFTGHCSYSYDCERWLLGCGRCPYPDTFPATKRDTTALEWRMKRAVYRRSRLTVVTPSRWLASLTRRSILGRFQVRCIPLGLDLDVFQPVDRGPSRRALGIPDDRLAVLFSAGEISDRRKGGDLLRAAFAGLPHEWTSRLWLVLMGTESAELAAQLRNLGFDLTDVGHVQADSAKPAIYGAADVLVFPTRADNMPLVIVESLACGTPVVSFDVGGVPELVTPGRTGALAPHGDPDGLRRALVSLLEAPDKLAEMRVACREHAGRAFNAELEAQRYVALYEELLRDRGTSKAG